MKDLICWDRNISQWQRFRHLTKVSGMTLMIGCLSASSAFAAPLVEVASDVEVTDVTEGKITIKGQIKDDQGLPVIGASIKVKGTTIGTISDMDGNFVLKVPNAKSTVIVNFIGYKEEAFVVGNQKDFNIKLTTDAISLDETVVIGYGVSKKKDITGSVSSLSADKLMAAPITSVDQGLRGKLAGVTVKQTSGAPGAGLKLRIRGGSSINYSNNPLYVVDGFIGADMTTINPSDIATIDVLKDASATAIYGSRGANGVVLITTHKAKAGKMKVTFDANFSASQMIGSVDKMNIVDMANVMNYQDELQGHDHSFSADDIAGFKKNGGEDWVDLVTRTAYKKNYTLSLSGGTDRLQYFLSGNVNDEQGIVEQSHYKRYSLRSNINAKINDKLKLTFNTYGVRTESQGNAASVDASGPNSTLGRATFYPSMWHFRDADGNQLDTGAYNDYNGRFEVGRDPNPVDDNRKNQENVRHKIVSNLDLTWDITPHLQLMVSNSGSYTGGLYGNRNYIDGIRFTRDNVVAQQSHSWNTSWMNTDMLTYTNTWGAHHLKASAVYEYSESENRNQVARVGDLSTLANDWYVLNNGTPSQVTSVYNKRSMRSYMGRVNYSYKDRYLLTASMRADGVSVFQSGNRWGYFPSAAVAWRASEEDFIKDIEWIYNLKVRGGFGTTGNTAVSPYATLQQFDMKSYEDRYYPFDGENVNEGVVVGAYTDPDLKWETTTQYNFGIDMAILKGRVSFVLDAYKKSAKDVIIAESIPVFTGHNSYTHNVAEIDNTGFEFTTNWNIMDTNDFHWDASFNVARNVSEVKDLGGQDHIFVDNEAQLGIWHIDHKFVVKQGEELGSFYGIKAMGLWQEDQREEAAKYSQVPGEMRYQDVDGDGSITTADRQIIGTAAPDFTYGISTNLAYKNWDMSIQCIGSQGNDIFNWTRANLYAKTMLSDLVNCWTPENPSSNQPCPIVGSDMTNSNVCSDYIEDGSYFKISNLTLGYTLPDMWCDHIGIQNIRLYASVNNLLTITNYSGTDPEASATPQNADSQAGIDAGSYPTARTYSAGIKINF